MIQMNPRILIPKVGDFHQVFIQPAAAKQILEARFMRSG